VIKALHEFSIREHFTPDFDELVAMSGIVD
jgi:hypothetical protein